MSASLVGRRTPFATAIAAVRGPAVAIGVGVIAIPAAFVVATSLRTSLLGIAGLMGVVTLLLVIPNPRLGPYLVFGIMPFTGWFFKQSPGGGFNLLSDVLIVVALAAVLIGRKTTWPPLSLSVPVLCLVSLGLIETLNPSGPADLVTAGYGIRDALLPMLLFFVGFFAFRSTNDTEQFIRFLMIIGIVNGLWALKQAVVGLDGGEQAWAGYDVNPTFYTHSHLKPFATFQAPWAYSYYTNVVIVLGICLFFMTKSLLSRCLVILALAASAAGLYLAAVRTAWLMLPLSLLVLVLLRIPVRLRWPLSAALSGMAALVLLLMVSASLPGRANPSAFGRTMSSLNILADDSMQARFQSWSQWSIPTALGHPFGTGLGTTGGVAKAFNPNGRLDTDNTYLSAAIEFGWLGLVAYIVLLSTGLILILRWHATCQAHGRRWLLAGLAAILAITIVSAFLNVYYNSANGKYFFFLLGLSAALGTRYGQERTLRLQPQALPAS